MENISKDSSKKDRIKATESLIEKQRENREREAEIRDLKATVAFLEKDRNDCKSEIRQHESTIHTMLEQELSWRMKIA